MSELYSTLSKLTKENLQNRLEKSRARQVEHSQKIKAAMQNIFTKITSQDYEVLMKTSATEGYNRCVLYKFERNELFEDFPLIFLTKGPMNYNGKGLDYFEEINVIPYIKLLQQYFTEFKVFYNTNHKDGSTTIEILWQ